MDRLDKDRNKRETQTRDETRILWILLGVLCVILVIAMVGQEYYRSHTYRKGELAQMSEQEPKQRLKFLTEEEVADARKNAGDGRQDSGTGEDSDSETAADKEKLTVVETAESVSLKNQLTGLLPGIKGPGETAQELIARADRLAAMYDYEAAISLLDVLRRISGGSGYAHLFPHADQGSGKSV